MKNKTDGNGWIQGMEWVAGSVVVLLIIGVGLSLFAHPAPGTEASEASVAAFLLALYLASWAYALVLLGLLFLSVRWLGDWWHMRVTRVAVRSHFLARKSLHMGMTPPVPSRLPEESSVQSFIPAKLLCNK